MKRLLLLALMALGLNVNAQLMNDSTVQFVGYWGLNETQTYRVLQNSYKVNKGDTIERETFNYDSEITILDSTATGYTIKWTYKSFDYKTGNKFTEKLMKTAQDMSIIYTTDELGVFQGVKNYQEIKNYMDKGFDTLLAEFKDIPNIGPIIQQTRQTFSTKEAVEAAAINEIHYFHAPFGRQFLTTMIYESESKLPNLYGGEPLDAKAQTNIVEVDTANFSSMIRIITSVDSTQAKSAVFDYFKQLAKASNLPEPALKDIPEFSIQNRFASNVHLPSGWVLDAFNMKEVKSGDVIKVDEVQITIK
ncbi:MAG TPA: hypothetical protein VFG54_00775 [Prolixibacteraceae bacterium]|nr:hypothetical protein [Prolixibacteraceae bacterium]